jgi:hypothetical protein
MNISEKKTSLPMLVFAWLVVMIPLGWGVSESVKKALPLFAPASDDVPPPAKETSGPR